MILPLVPAVNQKMLLLSSAALIRADKKVFFNPFTCFSFCSDSLTGFSMVLFLDHDLFALESGFVKNAPDNRRNYSFFYKNMQWFNDRRKEQEPILTDWILLFSPVSSLEILLPKYETVIINTMTISSHQPVVCIMGLNEAVN